jgi:precorrin-6B methylase 2
MRHSEYQTFQIFSTHRYVNFCNRWRKKSFARSMRATLALIILIQTVSCFSQDPWRNIYTESAWKERDEWQRPKAIIAHLALKPGSRVADVGCHEGYMTVKLAAVVGSTGRVYAVEVDQNRIDKLKRHLAERKIQNVTTIVGDNDDPKLPLNTLDAALIIDTYHEMDDHDDILRHIKESLKPGGRLVICEPIATDRKNSTRSEQERRHELGMNFVLQDLQKANLKILFRQEAFIDREKIKGDKMWIIVAVKE